MKSAKWWMGLLATLVSTSAGTLPAAAESQMVDEVEWFYSISDGAATVTEARSTEAMLTIPSTLGGYPVTGISGWGAFCSYGDYLTRVTIPSSVTNIDCRAFAECSDLGNIHVSPSNPAYASKSGVLFTKDGQTLLCHPGGKTGAYSIPDGVTVIGDRAFEGCGRLTSVSIPTSVRYIGYRAFADCCALTSVTIPDNVEDWDRPFEGCNNLKTLYLPRGFWKQKWGVPPECRIVYGHPEVVEGVEWLYAAENGFATMTDVLTSDTRLAIPSVLGGCPMTAIGEDAFSHAPDLTNVSIPNSVTNIAGDAFSYCTGLTTVMIPQCVCASRLSEVFRDAKGLKNVVVADGVTNIADRAFASYGGLELVSIPDSVTHFGENVFEGSALRTLYVPESWRGTGVPDPASLPDGCTVVYGAGAVLTNGILWVYRKTGDGVAVLGTEGIAGNALSIPPTLGGMVVTGIGERVFEGLTELTSATIPDSVTSIGDGAFSGCSGLVTLSIPNSVTNIGREAFAGCAALTSVMVPQCICSAHLSDVFGDSREIKNVVVADGVATIGDGAFSGCSGLEAVSFPDSVTVIGADAFEDSTSEIHLYVPDSWCDTGMLESLNMPEWECNVECGKAAVIAEGLFWIYADTDGGVAVFGNRGMDGNALDIPPTLGGRAVTGIGNGAFENRSDLASVIIPDGVTDIGAGAFAGCSGLKMAVLPQCVCSSRLAEVFPSAYAGITNVVVREGVAAIGESTFSGCRNLTSVDIPASVTNVGSNAFAGCEMLAAVNIHDLAAWCGIAFDGSPSWAALHLFVDGAELENLVIPDSVTSLGDWVFSASPGLASVMIPNSVTSIGKSAFRECTGLRSVIIKGGVTNIGDRAFFNCYNLEFLMIPNSVANIEAYAFAFEFGLYNHLGTVMLPQCVCSSDEAMRNAFGFDEFYAVTNIVIADGVTSIGGQNGRDIFSIFRNAESVNFPPSLKNIEEGTFSDCEKLENVHILDLAAWCNNQLGYGVPHLFVDGEEVVDLVVPEGVTNIGEDAFGGYSGLKSVTIPEGVTNIAERAFSWCTGLTSVEIGNSVTAIDAEAFSGCSGLTSVSIPDSVTNIAEMAFSGCGRLASVEIGNSVESIGWGAFERCGELMSVSIPGSLTHIEEYAFYECDRLTSVNIHDLAAWCRISFGHNPLGLAHHLFVDGAEVVALAISEGVTKISERAFEGASGLRSVAIPNGVTEIGRDAFRDCTGLTSAIIPESVTDIGQNAFENSGLLHLYVPESWMETDILSSANIPEGCTVVYGGKGAIAEEVFWTYRQADGGVVVLAADGWTGTALSIPPVLDGQAVTGIGARAFEGYGDFSSITIPDSVTDIGESAFRDCSRLAALALPEGLVSIGNSAFADCGALSGITIPESVLVLGDGAFSGCEGLASVTVLGNVVNNWATDTSPFQRCSNLREMVFGGRMREIGAYMCAKLSSLESVTIMEGVKIIGAHAFDECSALASLSLPDSVHTVNARAFGFCSSMKSLDLGRGLSTIGDAAFRTCSALTALSVPDSVGQIGAHAFYQCSALVLATLPESVRSVKNGAFSGCNFLKALYVPARWEGLDILDTAGVPEGCAIVYGKPEGTAGDTPVPCFWLLDNAAEILAAADMDYAAAAQTIAANKRPVWECYLAGLSPTDVDAEFKLKSISFVDGKPVVEWTPDLNDGGMTNTRTYTVQGKAAMEDVWGATNAASRFFRVKVALP